MRKYLKIGKYEFDSKEQAEEIIKQAFEEIKGEPLLEEQTIHNSKHCVSMIGFIPTEFNEDNEPITFSDKYSVDILFDFKNQPIYENEEQIGILEEVKEPSVLQPFAIEIEDEGVHGFAGLNYQSLKF